MSPISKSCQFRISGRVQGVGFRIAACDTARGLGLRGWVRNCANGDVEVVAAGTDAALARLRDWLWQGPSAARVSAVEETSGATHELPDGFDIR